MGMKIWEFWRWPLVGCVVSMALNLAFDVPGRWVDGWGEPLAAVAHFVFGVLLGGAVVLVWMEVERWRRLQAEYAAAQRDVERLERGER